MQWIVIDERIETYVGPFPSQDQAMTYAETLAIENNSTWGENGRYQYRRLQTPAYMPDRIHA